MTTVGGAIDEEPSGRGAGLEVRGGVVVPDPCGIVGWGAGAGALLSHEGSRESVAMKRRATAQTVGSFFMNKRWFSMIGFGHSPSRFANTDPWRRTSERRS